MADVPPVLLLAAAAAAARGDGEEEDPVGQQRADRRPGPGHAAPLVRGGRGGGEGKALYSETVLINGSRPQFVTWVLTFRAPMMFELHEC